jgi:hypothetical protein
MASPEIRVERTCKTSHKQRATFFKSELKFVDPSGDERQHAIDEIKIICSTAKTIAKAKGYDYTSVTDLIKMVGNYSFSILQDHLSIGFQKKTNKVLTLDHLTEIFMTHYCIATYGDTVSADAFFKEVSLDPEVWWHRHQGWHCDKLSYRAFMQGLDTDPSLYGQDFDGASKQNSLVSAFFDAVGKGFALLATGAKLPRTFVIDDHQIPACSTEMKKDGYKQKRNDKKTSAMGIVTE